MLRVLYSLSVLALAALTLLGCHKNEGIPAPVCYSGMVVGFDCQNGFLVQVDRQYPIGAPLRVSYLDSIARPNIIAAINQLGSMGTTGQRIYFTYEDGANQQGPAWACTTMQAWIRYPIPHVVLSNVSSTPCGQSQSKQ